MTLAMQDISLSPGSTRPELVSWNTTDRCNLECDHCYLAAGRQGSGELSFEEGCDLIDQLAASGTRMLILTGGEPLMRRDIVQLADHASSKDLMVVLGTNGMLLTEPKVRELKAAGVAGAGISLDSLDSRKHDRFRGVPGAWEGAVRGIRASVASGLPVLLQMTVMPWNVDEVARMMDFANDEGVTGFTLYFLVCTGRGERLSDITPAQYEEALASLVEAQPRYDRMMVRARCAPQISRMAAQLESALVGNAGCLAARQYCRITPKGEVTPCPYLPTVAGSVRESPFEEIWRSSEILERMRPNEPEGKCGRCDFKETCGGCRARASALKGDVLAEDPWCAYEPVNGAPAPSDGHLVWSAEAQERTERMPGFIRDRVRTATESQARAAGRSQVTAADLAATLEGIGRKIPFKRPGAARTAGNDGDAAE